MDELYSGMLNMVQKSVNQNNAWSAEQAQKQIDFQREMSNTAFQRQVADLKAAGLNPALSARLGGASTPSGASASADTSGTSAIASLSAEFMRQVAEGFASGAVGVGGSYRSAQDFENKLSELGIDPSDSKAVKDAVDRGLVSAQEIRDYLADNSSSGAKTVANALYSYSQSRLPLSGVARGLSTALNKFSGAISNYVRKNGPANSASGAYLAMRYAESKENSGSNQSFGSKRKSSYQPDVSVMSYKRDAR